MGFQGKGTIHFTKALLNMNPGDKWAKIFFFFLKRGAEPQMTYIFKYITVYNSKSINSGPFLSYRLVKSTGEGLRVCLCV